MVYKKRRVWAIKLNSEFIELKTTLGPAKVLKGIITKPAKMSVFDPTTGGYKTVPTTVTMQQSTIIGGRTLGVIRTEHMSSIGRPTFKDDIAKLSPEMALRVMDESWREANL